MAVAGIPRAFGHCCRDGPGPGKLVMGRHVTCSAEGAVFAKVCERGAGLLPQEGYRSGVL